MRVVADTNILISALLFGGLPEKFLFAPTLFRAVSSIRRNSLHFRFRVSVDSLMLRIFFDLHILCSMY
jgi:hypothetical protein